jgi:hypothetical protein
MQNTFLQAPYYSLRSTISVTYLVTNLVQACTKLVTLNMDQREYHGATFVANVRELLMF